MQLRTTGRISRPPPRLGFEEMTGGDNNAEMENANEILESDLRTARNGEGGGYDAFNDGGDGGALDRGEGNQNGNGQTPTPGAYNECKTGVHDCKGCV